MRRVLRLAALVPLIAGCSGHHEKRLDPERLPQLPAKLIAVQRGADTALFEIDGHEPGRLEGYRLAGHGYLSKRGRRYRLDRHERRVVLHAWRSPEWPSRRRTPTAT